MTNRIDRRSFLIRAAATPLALAAPGPGAFWLPRGDDRLLLVLELVGGNDGLNTVIPVDDDNYKKARPTIGSVRNGAHALTDGTALHPALAQLHRRIQDGKGAVVHGVGYPQPDRSHFRSRDIWHTADPLHQEVKSSTTGWLGRAADQLSKRGAGVPAAAVGGLEVPLALRAKKVNVPSLARVEDFQWLSARSGGTVAAGAPVRAVVDHEGQGESTDELMRFVGDVARKGASLADELAAALADYRPRAEYPGSDLGRNLGLVAQLAVAGFGTRLVHVGLSGFDTHARQLPTHAGLMRELDGALSAFLMDIEKHGLGDRVTVLVHSEFGRRVKENASQGTDHGAAGPVFAFGGGIQGGPHGQVPNLEDLDDGDVKSTADFRDVYADLLRWLGAETRPVLGGEFRGVGLT